MMVRPQQVASIKPALHTFKAWAAAGRACRWAKRCALGAHRTGERSFLVSLFWRIFLLNAAVLIAATALLLLGPVTVSTPVLLTEAAILTGGLAAMLVANAVL